MLLFFVPRFFFLSLYTAACCDGGEIPTQCEMTCCGGPVTEPPEDDCPGLECTLECDATCLSVELQTCISTATAECAFEVDDCLKFKCIMESQFMCLETKLSYCRQKCCELDCYGKIWNFIFDDEFDTLERDCVCFDALTLLLRDFSAFKIMRNMEHFRRRLLHRLNVTKVIMDSVAT